MSRQYYSNRIGDQFFADYDRAAGINGAHCLLIGSAHRQTAECHSQRSQNSGCSQRSSFHKCPPFLSSEIISYDHYSKLGATNLQQIFGFLLGIIAEIICALLCILTMGDLYFYGVLNDLFVSWPHEWACSCAERMQL